MWGAHPRHKLDQGSRSRGRACVPSRPLTGPRPASCRRVSGNGAGRRVPVAVAAAPAAAVQRTAPAGDRTTRPPGRPRPRQRPKEVVMPRTAQSLPVTGFVGRHGSTPQLVLHERLTGRDTFLTGILEVAQHRLQVRIITLDDVTVLRPVDASEITFTDAT